MLLSLIRRHDEAWPARADIINSLACVILYGTNSHKDGTGSIF